MKDTHLHEILKYLSKITYLPSEEIPDMELYMDQVITLMDKYLASTKRNPEDKLLTKTMINNYVKNDLLPPPNKKKYTKEHVLTLAFIYYFKNMLSISDIQRLLKPLMDHYFGDNGDLQLEDIYKSIFDLKYPIIHDLAKDLKKKTQMSRQAAESLENVNEEDGEFIGKFAFICTLAADVYLKKLVMEYVIDSMDEPDEKKKDKR